MPSYAMPPTPSGIDDFAWRAAISTVRGYCQWHISPVVTEDVVVEGGGAGHLLLPSLRVTAINSITNDGVAVVDTDYEWSRRGILRVSTDSTLYRGWSRKYDSVVVNITHGYEDFPAEVLAVARDMARADGVTGASSMASGPHQLQLGVTSAAAQAGSVGMSDLQKNVLARYRIPTAP